MIINTLPDIFNNEPELLHRIAEGDESSFTLLVEEYGKVLYSFIWQHCKSRELAEEIVQDIFTQLWITREGLTQIKNLKAYLYVIARNYARDAIRKLMREKKKLLEYENQQVTNDVDELSDKDFNRLGIIKRAVDQLPAQQQRAWTLARMEGLSYAEIATIMGISKETVKKYLQYATASIIKYVETHMEVLLILSMLPLI